MKESVLVSSQAPVVSTSTGKLSGIRDEKTGLCRFLGIPYAEPPLGDLRFMSTVAKSPWQGVREAVHFGHSGPQVFDQTEGSYEEFTDAKPGKDWVGSEDNLTLNVWTPSPDDKKRPVMVWIHGGANWLESSRLATYHGDRLVERGDVVFVSINYRLGIFGFIDMSVLGGDTYRGSHMNGLRDQLEALRWIRRNIAAFGGDPSNITVMGESAGSIDLSWLLTSGHLGGIAKRVVLMSGVAGLMGLSGDLISGFTEEYGQQQSRNFFLRLGVDSMQALLALSTDQIMERVTDIKKSSDMLFCMDSLFWPRVDAGFAPVDPFRAAQSKGSYGIDVMIGYTAYEMGLWLFWDETLDQHSCKWAAEKIMDFPTSLQEESVKVYAQSFAKEKIGTHGMHLLGDSIFVMPSMWFADEISRHASRVWMYQFDWKADERRGALHAADQAYLFNKLDTHAAGHLIGLPKNSADRAAREKLSYAMQDAIFSFVRHGDPNDHGNPALPVWPRYDSEKRPVMSFNTDCKIVHDPAGTRRKWWYDRIYEPSLKST